MSHQSQLEKIKYRNWVRGGLAYKYLKEGIEGFADDVVQQEHTRILSDVSPTPGLTPTCNQCYLRDLRPLHKCEKDPFTGRIKCPWGQSKCNCLYPKKHPCSNQICDRIMEDILKSHGSTPPTPNWKNTDIQKWCSDPWEIAKCFINAPGYSDKTQAADIDTPGLLHVFINNINLQSHLSDKINGSDTFKKTLQRRNEIFHSPTMEMADSKLNERIDEIIEILEDEKELKARHDAQQAVLKLKQMADSKLNERIDEIIEILEDEKELKARHDAQQAVLKLKQLKQDNFVITTHNEVEVFKDALVSVTNMSEELKQTIQDAKGDIDEKEKEITGAAQEAKNDIGKRQKEATDAIQDVKDEIGKKQKETTAAIQDANDDLRTLQKEATDAVKGAIYDIGKRQKEATDVIQDAKDEIGKSQKQAANAIQDATDGICKKQKETTDAIQDAKFDIDKKQKEATKAIQDAKDDFSKKQKETTDAIQDAKRDLCTKQKEAIEAIQDKKQKALQEIDKHSTSTVIYERVGRLELDNSVSKQRITILESKVDELDIIRQNHQKQLEYVEGKEVFQKKLVELYQNHYVNTSVSPLKLEENYVNIKEVYVNPKIVVEEKPDRSATSSVENAQSKQNIRSLTGYREILQTNGQKHKHVYIVGDIGTGKSTFSKMMLQNWCSAVTADNFVEKCEETRKHNVEDENDNDSFIVVNEGNINELRNYDFLFFVPLQRMSGLGDIIEMVKKMVTGTATASNEIVDRIFEQESERCLIVADGLDEWTPPKNKCNLPHVSYGLPKRDQAKDATVVTLSRPSAKGILNLKFTECDQKVELLGIGNRSVKCFIETYLSMFKKEGRSFWEFIEKIEIANFKHLERTPLLLQQLVWLYCTGSDIGRSISDTYSQIINIMLGWSLSKDEGDDNDEDQMCDTKEDKDMKLPELLQRFPRCEANKRFLLPLARVAYKALTSEMGANTFGRSHLRKSGVPREGIAALIKFGFLVENNCFDPTLEKTQMEFIHVSYLEFLAAVHISSHLNKQKCSILQSTVLQDLFQNCKSAADVLQLSNVLKMICGLSPFLVSEISKLVSDIVSGDESMISYRNSLPGFWYRYRHHNVSYQIQRLILNCLSECDSVDQTMISLCDVIIEDDTEMSFLQRIIPDNVLSLCAYNVSDIEIWRWITSLTRLQYVHIQLNELPHDKMVLLSSLIKEAPLKYLTLDDVQCDISDYLRENIDLSTRALLLSTNGVFPKLEFGYCNREMTTDINTTHIETVCFGYANTLNIACLSNASSLTELKITGTWRDHSGYNERVNDVVHTLQKLRKLRLVMVNIADQTRAFAVTPDMRNLEHIELEEVDMSLQTWCTFLDSLLALQQSVQVDLTSFWTDVCGVEDKRNYVRRNTIMFEVMKDDYENFSFMTKK